MWHYTDALWPDHIPFRAIWNLQSIWSCFFSPPPRSGSVWLTHTKSLCLQLFFLFSLLPFLPLSPSPCHGSENMSQSALQATHVQHVPACWCDFTAPTLYSRYACVCLHRWCEAPLVVDVWPYKQQCVNISNCIDLEANVSDCERKYITSCSLYISYFEINSTFFYCILSSQLWPDAFMCLSTCFLSTQHLRKFTVLTRTLSWTQCVCWINQEPL